MRVEAKHYGLTELHEAQSLQLIYPLKQVPKILWLSSEETRFTIFSTRNYGYSLLWYFFWWKWNYYWIFIKIRIEKELIPQSCFLLPMLTH